MRLDRIAVYGAGFAVAQALGCGGQNGADSSSGGGAQATGATGGSAAGGSAAAGNGNGGSASGGLGGSAGASAGPFELWGAPLIATPTGTGFGLNAVLTSGSPAQLFAQVRVAGTTDWQAPLAASVRGDDVAEWSFDGLAPGTRYEYAILGRAADEEWMVDDGSVRTQRPPGEAFTFSLLTDSHIGSDLTYGNQGNPAWLTAVSEDILGDTPDFMVNLGDMLDFHQFGFNLPPPDGTYTRQAYLNYRSLLGPTLGQVPHYGVIGNWEGENGDFSTDQIAWSRAQRLLYLPNPEPTTYAEGGSPDEDYYAFTWGDALFIVLNVMSYTPTPHLLGDLTDVADDWTLGPAQFAWFEETLANATAKWRFVLIHHAVGGGGPDPDNAAYGRGGAQAAHVGEQALVHQLMLDYSVQIFFYGHDHVFWDDVVDGIHYTLPGSAGAPWMFGPTETGYDTPYDWQVPGHARVDVSPGSVHVQFLGLGNQLIYEYQLEQ